MIYKINLLMLGFIFAFVSLSGADKKITDKPMIEQFDSLDKNCNIVVTFKNVTDKNSDHHNKTFIWLDHNLYSPSLLDEQKNQHIYYLFCQPGKYKLEGLFHLVNGWDDKEFSILASTDSIQSSLNERKYFTIALDKKPNGRLKRAKNRFTEEKENIQAIEFSQTSKKQNPIQPNVSYRWYSSPLSKTQNPDKVTVYINTHPVFTRVIVDEQQIGQTPLSTIVDKNIDHVFQIYLNGYKSQIILLYKNDMKNSGTMYLSAELEKL